MNESQKLKLLEIFGMILDINENTECEVFLDVSPHVNQYAFRIHEKGWKKYNDDDYIMESLEAFEKPRTENYEYSFYSDNEDFDVNLDYILELLRRLQND